MHSSVFILRSVELDSPIDEHTQLRCRDTHAPDRVELFLYLFFLLVSLKAYRYDAIRLKE